MDVFISWSGKRSRAAAEALSRWLRLVMHAVRPWLSSTDIRKGVRWSSDVASRLATSKVGILCVTPSSVHSDWLLFEAGALSKTLENTYVCPLLIGLSPSEIDGPLSQFQATRATKDDIEALVTTINSVLGEDALPPSDLQLSFERWWPDLETKLNSLPEDDAGASNARTDRDVLEEILVLLRSQAITNVRQNEQAAKSGKVIEALRIAAMRGNVEILAFKFVPDPTGEIVVDVTTSEGSRVIRLYDENADVDTLQAAIVPQLLRSAPKAKPR